MDTKLLDVLDKKLEENIQQFVDSLSSGVAKDYADYKELCGAIRGLRTAQREAKDLVRKLKEIDDE